MTGEAFKPGWDQPPGGPVEPVGYLRRAQYSFTDLLTGEHREGVWDQDSALTPEEVASQVFGLPDAVDADTPAELAAKLRKRLEQ